MEEKLTQEELLLIEEGISFHKTSGAKILKGGILASVLASIIGYTIMGFTLLDVVLMFLGLILLTLYIWYSVFERPKSRLKQDHNKGTKIVQAATVKRVKNNSEGKFYQLSNGLKIKESDFEENQTLLENIGKGKELLLSYTPHHKMILNIEEKTTAPNQI
ncbi:hypothetical protein I0P70_13720 [Pontibacter sp. FD36]|uniref:hypothetical protein n=1 Tax=Pontibacter sp. FD36 TaxID=2789860 RepID=UPI0018AA8AE5|nr:hypothetical protein [Pontibacter sp. FD36]MBF8964307.1 hypothetical protein [Pontibacter sp. FD36]